MDYRLKRVIDFFKEEMVANAAGGSGGFSGSRCRIRQDGPLRCQERGALAGATRAAHALAGAS